ncbi:MAG: hypothetical protein PUC90_04260 [Prevotella sp.]|nr:hypothetical protein [Prevotella sp.]
MKQNFTCHLKTTILAIIFLLSGAIPANSQNIYFKDKEIHQIGLSNNKADVSDLVQPFYCGVDDNIFSLVEGQEYTISKTPITISDAKFGNIVEQDIFENNSKLSKALTLRIDEKEDSKILCCNIVAADWNYNKTITFKIAVHDMPLVEEQPATCTSDGYRKYKCACCNEERTETLYALGHSYGEWQEMAGGHMRTCSNDANHKQYNMDATGVNALEITLTDDTKLSYPSTLSPVVTFNDLDVAIGFDTDKTSLVNKVDIAAYNQVWSHNKNGYAPNNEDNTYSHACDVAGCTVKYDDLFVKNGKQYYVAEKKNGVIKVADMTLNDSEGYDCEADITVGSVSYSRDMKDNQWGTLCLPFAINPNAYSDCSFYKLSSVDNKKSEIVLSRIDDSTIAAGTPVLVRRNAAVSSISISVPSEGEGDGVVMSKNIQTGSTVGEYSLVGRLTTSNALTDNCYIINNDKFWNVGELNNAGKTVKVGAFRSYLEANTSMAQARMLSLSIGGDNTTAIDVLNAADDGEAEIYDLNGHRLSDLQKGMNIIKRGNKITKVIIK